MKIYYKATRTDGFDFFSGTVDYAGALASGKPVKRKPATDEYGAIQFACCSDTVYHASDAPSETLIGGEWPCRLFEGTGRPVAQEGHKHGFRSLRVLGEVPAWQALGPNGEAVAALIERASRLTREEAEQLQAARDAARDAAWAASRAAAWDAARDAAGVAAGVAAGDAARAAAWDVAWAAAGDAARAAARDAAGDAARDVAGIAARDAARDVAGIAARALVARDLISEEHFNALYGPWASVLGEVPA
ncbi:hypothetical protein [Streptomyces sp. CC53]|uniref:hypothetical protein n=1 Tax=Streptomyces sp. CC53 TaxID=1906740 RepID=UPI0015A66DC7|nr:hypothetical protein [Streptomyces sp. CC53]